MAEFNLISNSKYQEDSAELSLKSDFSPVISINNPDTCNKSTNASFLQNVNVIPEVIEDKESPIKPVIKDVFEAKDFKSNNEESSNRNFYNHSSLNQITLSNCIVNQKSISNDSKNCFELNLKSDFQFGSNINISEKSKNVDLFNAVDIKREIIKDQESPLKPMNNDMFETEELKVNNEDSSNSSFYNESLLNPSSSSQDQHIAADSEEDDLDLSEINQYESTEEDYDTDNSDNQELQLEMENSVSNSEDYELSEDCSNEPHIKTEADIKKEDKESTGSSVGEVKRKGKRIPQFKRNMVKPSDYNFTDLNKLEPGNNQCHVCKKTFELRNKLLAHFTIHPPDNPFLFDLSKKGSVIMNIDRVPPTPEELKIKPFACALCPKRFKNYGGLVAHCCVHTGEKPYVCNVCSKAYRDKQYLKGHALLHMGQVLYSCDLCKKSFTRKQNLKTHYLTHTGERPHVCDVCNATFRKKHLMIIHCRIHTNEYPFSCKVCCRRFRSKSQLVSHTFIHEQTTPHQCEKCPKSFNQKRWLLKHMEFHEGKRRYECPDCFKCFVRKLELQVHMAYHTGKWPLVCDICDKGFTKPCYLKVHKQIHLEGTLNELLPLNIRGRAMNVPYDVSSSPQAAIKTNMNEKHSLLRSMLQS